MNLVEDDEVQLRLPARREPRIDPRSARVRAKLLAAVSELSASGEQVSVSALVRRAGVSRSAFYLQFNDLADFAMHLQRTYLEQITVAALAERGADAAAAMLHAQRRLVNHFSMHRELYRSAMALSPHRSVEDGVAAAIADAVRQHLDAIDTMPATLRPELVVKYFAHAATGLLTEWVMARGDVDAETMAQHLFALLPVWMYCRETSEA